MDNYQIGDLLVTEHGVLVMLTQDGLQTGEMNANGAVPSFLEGISLLSAGRWRGTVVRKVGTIRDAINQLAASGVDLTTPATKSESELTDRELLAKVLRDNAELKQLVAALVSK
jgi:hypothetical protein